MKKVFFIGHDGTLVIEPPVDYRLGSLEKLEFYPKVVRNLGSVCGKLDFEFVMVTSQDELGTISFPEEAFWPAHSLMMKTLEDKGVTFDSMCIDRGMPKDNAPTRKPRTDILTKCLGSPDYNLVNSFMIGDRTMNVELVKNLSYRTAFLQEDMNTLKPKSAGGETACEGLEDVHTLITEDWDRVAEFLFAGERKAEVRRITKETNICIATNLDGSSRCDIRTGLGFFDHMLEQIGRHDDMDLTIHVKGDLEVGEHYTIGDAALALSDCLYRALGNKRSIEHYGYALPMDDCLYQVRPDFGRCPWLVQDARFKCEKIGEMSTKMFLHFFKSLSDAAKVNLNIKAEGQNEHHKIEEIFKASTRTLKMAVGRDIYHYELPSSKGILQLSHSFIVYK